MYAERMPPQDHRSLALWLLICCLLVFSMVMLGGVTRLTGSGLSMVEWDPIFGVVPPLSTADWEAVAAACPKIRAQASVGSSAFRPTATTCCGPSASISASSSPA